MSIARRQALVMLTLGVVGAPGAHAQGAVWYAVRGVDRSFIVDMPGEPAYKVIDAVSTGGVRYANHSYSLDNGRLSFVVQTALLPAVVDVSDPRRALQAVLDDRATRLDGAKWTRVDWRQVQGLPAVESSGPVQGGRVLRQLEVLRGRRIVSLACLGAADAVRGPEAERFFASLRFPS
jgi:hypothetical protein